jgi:hypothetical protein
MEIIRLRDALDLMEKPTPFSIAFVTADKKRKTGGNLIRMENCLQSGYLSGKDPEERKDVEPSATTKNPNHSYNGTRNIFVKGATRLTKIHIRLITQFNNKKVVY